MGTGTINRRVIVFVRLPRPGHVKSRLAAAVGGRNACAVYRALVSDVVEVVGGSGIPLVFAYDPPGRAAAVAKWLGRGRTYLPQRGGDIGERMNNAFIDVFSAGADEAVLIGSDIAGLSPGRIGEAFRTLADWNAVIGPACDGGYYLIGFRREALVPEVFGSIRWGTETVFRDTMEVLRARGAQAGVIGHERDVDTAEGLRELLRRFEGCGPGARHTRSLVASRKGLLDALGGSSEQGPPRGDASGAP